MNKPFTHYRIITNGNLFEAQGLADHELYGDWVRLKDGPFKNPASEKTTSEMLVDWYKNYYTDGWQVVETYEA